MNSLIIDCSAGMKLFLLKGDNCFSFVDDNQKKHTDELLVAVDNLLNAQNLSVGDLDVIGVFVGPGSFTGIRVAVSICKGLAIESNIKIVQLSNFDAYEIDSDNYVLCLEGFSNNVYVRICSNGKVEEKCLSSFDLCENKNNFKNYDYFVSNEKTQRLLNNVEILSIIANYNPILCFKNKILNGNYITIDQISPVYLRASQAEIERQKKLEGI